MDWGKTSLATSVLDVPQAAHLVAWRDLEACVLMTLPVPG